MAVLKVFMLLVFTRNVLSEEALGLICASEDIECIKKSAEIFLQKTSVNIPNMGIIGIDPLFLSEFDIDLRTEGVFLRNTNLTVTGMKDMKLKHFEMIPETTSISLILEEHDIHLAGQITITFFKSSTVLSGHQTSNASVSSTVMIPYETKTDPKGIEYFEVGNETTTCNVKGIPSVNFDQQLQKKMATLEEVRNLPAAKQVEISNLALCKVVEKMFETFVNNINKATKVHPTTNIFAGLTDEKKYGRRSRVKATKGRKGKV